MILSILLVGIRTRSSYVSKLYSHCQTSYVPEIGVLEGNSRKVLNDKDVSLTSFTDDAAFGQVGLSVVSRCNVSSRCIQERQLVQKQSRTHRVAATVSPKTAGKRPVRYLQIGSSLLSGNLCEWPVAKGKLQRSTDVACGTL